MRLPRPMMLVLLLILATACSMPAKQLPPRVDVAAEVTKHERSLLGEGVTVEVLSDPSLTEISGDNGSTIYASLTIAYTVRSLKDPLLGSCLSLLPNAQPGFVYHMRCEYQTIGLDSTAFHGGTGKPIWEDRRPFQVVRVTKATLLPGSIRLDSQGNQIVEAKTGTQFMTEDWPYTAWLYVLAWIAVVSALLSYLQARRFRKSLGIRQKPAVTLVTFVANLLILVGPVVCLLSLGLVFHAILTALLAYSLYLRNDKNAQRNRALSELLFESLAPFAVGFVLVLSGLSGANDITYGAMLLTTTLSAGLVPFTGLVFAIVGICVLSFPRFLVFKGVNAEGHNSYKMGKTTAAMVRASMYYYKFVRSLQFAGFMLLVLILAVGLLIYVWWSLLPIPVQGSPFIGGAWFAGLPDAISEYPLSLGGFLVCSLFAGLYEAFKLLKIHRTTKSALFGLPVFTDGKGGPEGEPRSEDERLAFLSRARLKRKKRKKEIN